MDELQRRQKSDFLQAEGLKLPRQMRGHEVTKFTKIALVEILDDSIVSNNYVYSHFKTLWLHFFEEYGSDFPATPALMKSYLKKYIDTAHGSKILALIEAVCRQNFCKPGYFEALKSVMERERLAYRLFGTLHDPDDRPTLMPVSNEEQANALARDYAAISDHGNADAVKRHLQSASTHIGEGKFKDSVRESIHAVESAAKTASGKTSATLNDALSALERQRSLHPALRNALSKLYGWTSDEKGIRHAEIGPEDPVPEHMALFMLSSCAAFSAWLLNSVEEGLAEKA